ncbi:MAG TPA: RNA polymerase sigma factor [Vicinamibacterales bacterium]
MNALTDEELIAQYHLAPASDRSRQLLDELFRRHRARVVAWCYRLTGDRDLAPDLAQDVFVKAYSSLHMFRRDAKFTTWLYTIARNRCRDEARAARRREAPEGATVEPSAEWNEALAALDARDARHAVQTLMNEVLDETEKRVMTLHYGHDMRLDAITTALGLTNSSGAKAYIVSAKRKLSAAVSRWKMKS